MTAVYAAAFLEVLSPGGQSVIRWQSRWQGATVAWDGRGWDYARFEWQGDVAGGPLGEAQASLTLPMLGSVYEPLRQATVKNCLTVLTIYHYADTLDDSAGPPATGMVLVGQIAGLLSIDSSSTTQIEIIIGSRDAIGGDTFPPRSADVTAIGIPCVLEV